MMALRSTLRSTVSVVAKPARRTLSVRASAEAPKTPEAPIAASETVAAAAEPVAPAPVRKSPPTFFEIMGFSGLGPELINGRLCMLAFVAGAAAELKSGESIIQQFADAPGPILIVTLLVIAGSLIPMRNTGDRAPFGMFNAAAETLNGRAAMVGFAALLLIDTATKTHFN